MLMSGEMAEGAKKKTWGQEGQKSRAAHPRAFPVKSVGAYGFLSARRSSGTLGTPNSMAKAERISGNDTNFKNY